ncbi:MAG: protein-glutamine glutaminase family protein [Bacteriovoracaceae bacterium]|jgi:hypothetical protein|nr:hypothetical protein [Halobacteriovoraceae bacterium]MDP7322027.1 protein-glutamine glutaminase family protein [Bacteriovoracaceae bacterium]
MKQFPLFLLLMGFSISSSAQTALVESHSKFSKLLSQVESEHEQADMSYKINQMESMIKRGLIKWEDYDLEQDDFDSWRETTANITAEKIKNNCQKGLINYRQVELENEDLSDTQIYKHAVKHNVSLSVLSEAQAQEIFNILRAHKRTLAHEEYGNGCESRAHKMALIMDLLCVNSGKAFVESENIQLEGHSWGWTYHVAPVVLVASSEGVKPYIMDPSIFDKAVELGTWMHELSKMNPENQYDISFTNKYILRPYEKDLQKDEYDLKSRWQAEYTILKRKMLRLFRPLIGPLKK